MSSLNGCLIEDEATPDARKFGFDDYAASLASIIADPNLKTPFTISVYGEWGSGKTSLMMSIAKNLEPSKWEKKIKVDSQKNSILTSGRLRTVLKRSKDLQLKPVKDMGIVKVVWFNAWEFQKLQTPLWTIFLNRVMMDLSNMTEDDNLKERIKALGKGFLLLSADALLSRTIDIKTKDLEELKERVWTDIKKIDCLREELSQKINEALESDPYKRQRLAIFIDDLDRCLPEQCVEIFESIKLFLNCENCVFVIGVDKEQLRKVFQEKFYGKESKEEKRALGYIEKFVQLEFDLPPKTQEEVSEFVLEYVPERLKSQTKTIELISKYIEPNPRKIKRWLNSIMFLERLFAIRQERSKSLPEIDISLASIWLFLKSFFPDFALLVAPSPSVLNTAINVAKGTEEKQTIGDFKLDKRLIEFLSSLESTFDENQLVEIIHLSKLTPVSDFSSIPGDKHGTAMSLRRLALIESKKHNFEKAMQIYKESLKMSLETNDEVEVAATYLELGTLEFSIGEYSIAQSHFTEGLDYYRKLNDLNGQARASLGLGVTLAALRQYVYAFNFFEKSLEIYKAHGDYDGVASVKDSLNVIKTNISNEKDSLLLDDARQELLETIDRILQNIIIDKPT